MPECGAPIILNKVKIPIPRTEEIFLEIIRQGRCNRHKKYCNWHSPAINCRNHTPGFKNWSIKLVEEAIVFPGFFAIKLRFVCFQNTQQANGKYYMTGRVSLDKSSSHYTLLGSYKKNFFVLRTTYTKHSDSQNSKYKSWE